MSATPIEDANVDLLRRYFAEIWDRGNVDALTSFLAESFLRHTAPLLPSLGRAAQIERLKGFRTAFPDVTVLVEDVVAQGDRVAFRSTMRGTHTGEFMGVAPTGRRIEVGLVDVIRVEDGRFAEQWGGPDVYDMLRQLGATIR